MECFIGTIIPWTGDYEPLEWLYCRGQQLLIQQHAALYSVIGARFGGDGQRTFNLPDLRQRVIVGSGKTYFMSQIGGEKDVLLQQSQMPAHRHMLQGNTNAMVNGDNAPSTARVLGVATTVAARPVLIKVYNKVNQAQLIPMSEAVITSVGTGERHNNMQPYVVLDYIICVRGIYPVRAD